MTMIISHFQVICDDCRTPLMDADGEFVAHFRYTDKAEVAEVMNAHAWTFTGLGGSAWCPRCQATYGGGDKP